MKRWWLLVGLLLSVGLNVGILSTLAFQRLDRPVGEEMRDDEAMPFRPQLLAKRLSLQGALRERFLTAHRELLGELENDRQRVERARRALRQQLIAPRPDEHQLEASVGELGAALAGREERIVAHVLAMRRLLRPHQERMYLEALRRWAPETMRQRRPRRLESRRDADALPRRPDAPD